MVQLSEQALEDLADDLPQKKTKIVEHEKKRMVVEYLQHVCRRNELRELRKVSTSSVNYKCPLNGNLIEDPVIIPGLYTDEVFDFESAERALRPGKEEAQDWVFQRKLQSLAPPWEGDLAT